MKNRWFPATLLTPLLFCLIGCDQEPPTPKGSAANPRVMATGSLEPLVEKAWNLMASRKYDECSTFIDAEFARIESKAREQEKGLQFFPEMKKGYQWHELDGAGNLLRVKQESLKRQGKYEEAVPVWEMMFREFPHFQSWRVPNRTWRPASEARTDWQAYRLLKAIKERKLESYEYVTDTIFDHNSHFGQVAGQDLLFSEDFDGLEYAFEFFTTHAAWRNHSRSGFMGGLMNSEISGNSGSGEAMWKKKKEHIDHWIAAKPGSPWAKVALAKLWISYAWLARGSGWADSVKEEDWNKFRDRIEKAHEVLEAASHDCPLWYSARLTVCMAESAEPSEINSIFTEGIRKYPWASPIYSSMTTILLPRWLGQPGDWQDFAAIVGKEQGAVAYLNVCLDVGWYEGSKAVVADKSVNWTLLKEGFEQDIKEHPKAIWLKNTYAAFAWLRKDQAAGKRAFQLIDNKAHPDVWDTEAGFLDVKRWAEK